jgi:hypothetical protein
MHPFFTTRAFLLAAVLALPPGAHAADPQPPAPQAQPPRAGDSLGAAANDALLARARGGSDLTVIDTKLSGAVAGNAATNVTTGWNVIQSGSFANMAGIPIVVQNTGANVLIQNATVINLQLK